MFRSITADEYPTFYRRFDATFGGDARDEEIEVRRPIFELDRTLAGFDDGEIVATSTIFSQELTVPGGMAPMAAVSEVTVAPTHRRQGLLTTMMGRLLAGVHEAGGEPVAALWASESAIYGRFGYGMATRSAALRVDGRRMRLLPRVELADGRIRTPAIADARTAMAAVYERARGRTPGFIRRSPAWWDGLLADLEHRRHGATARRCALHERPDGEVDGYLLYRLKEDWGDQGNHSQVVVTELFADDSAVRAALWRFAANIDLFPIVTHRRSPVDEPLQHMVTAPREVQLTVRDGLWVRLVEVDRALAARCYSAPVDVVFEVTDAFCGWNAGRFRLSGDAGGAVCERTTAPADLAVDVADLAAAYLGGPSLAVLADAGRVRELRPGALDAASAAFVGRRAPWCPEVF